MFHIKFITLGLLLGIVLTSCGLAYDGALIYAHEAFEKKEYDRALAKISYAENYKPKLSEKEQREILLLKARIYEGKGDSQAYTGLYKYLAEKYPESEEGYIAVQKVKDYVSK